MNVHRQILVAHSRFFAVKLSEKWIKQQRMTLSSSPPYNVDVADCDDVEVYIEALRLMYCKDLRRWLMKEDVPEVLGILKVSAAIGFDAGVLSCLEYLEAAPWVEDEEEHVALVKQCRSKVETELSAVCVGILELLQSYLVLSDDKPWDDEIDMKEAAPAMHLLIMRYLQDNTGVQDGGTSSRCCFRGGYGKGSKHQASRPPSPSSSPSSPSST